MAAVAKKMILRYKFKDLAKGIIGSGSIRNEDIMAAAAALEVNDKAPAFTLLNEQSQPVSLKDFNGKNIVLFFYPKADTPG